MKTLGNYEKMLAENPNVIEELREEAKRLTLEKQQSRQSISLSYLPKEILSVEDALPSYGFGHAVLEKVWNDLALSSCFEKALSKRKKRRLVMAMKSLLFHRLLDPSSVRSAQQDLGRYAGRKADYLDLYYEALEAYCFCKEEMIDHLCQQFEEKTGRERAYAYYDVTTYAFESVRAGKLRLFGYSKDHKNNEVQVVMGLLMDEQGMPVSYTLFPGNTMDQSTLEVAVSDLKKRYRMEKIVVVAVRGLNSKENLSFLLREGHDFVMSYSLKKGPADLQDLLFDENGWMESRDQEGRVVSKSKRVLRGLEVKRRLSEEEQAQVPPKRGRRQKYKTETVDVAVHLTWNEARAAKDRADRERILEKVKADLNTPEKIRAQAKRGRSQYIQYPAEYQEAQLDEARIARQECFDGYYAVVTNQMDWSTQEVSQIYGGLWKIEESFRVSKTDLEARPVYVWTDEHIRGHFALCFLALCFHRYLQRLLRRDGRELSASRIRQALFQAKVVIQGEYPAVLVCPTGISQDYLHLWEAVHLPSLYSHMKLSEFKRLTGLDLSVNLEE